MEDLFAVRDQLVQAVYATERPELWKGSDAWRAHQAARAALDQFDLAHPLVLLELYARLEEVAARVGVAKY